jgi:hypothetical protein
MRIRRPNDRRRSGFTFVEATISIAFFTMLMTSFGSVFMRSHGVADRSYTNVRANEEHDRNLRAVADLLRCAAWDTLTGFQPDGTSATPCFCRVLGSDASGRLMDVPETLCWRAATKPAPGVSNPGELVLMRNGVPTTLVCERVPAGGFLVTQSGNTLKVTLSTYYAASNGTIVTVSGNVSVSLRN